MNADVVEAYDAGITAVNNLKRPKNGDVKGTASFIRELCDVLRDWFDDILGEGSGDSILPRDSMFEGMTAFRELIEAQQQANKETQALWADLEVKEDSDNQTNNRQQRRAQKRQQQRNKQRPKRKAPVDLYAPERLEQ